VARRWYGHRAYFSVNPGDPSGHFFTMPTSFDNPSFSDGDKLLRTMLGWQVQTELTDGGGIPGRGPWPMGISAVYSPDPGGDPLAGNGFPIGGAALWRESIDWRREYFTDGATHSWCWSAHSGQLRSTSVARDIIDTTIASLDVSIGFDDSAADSFPADVDYAPLTAFGYVWLEYLVEQ
jgi:hypothetical protein